MNRREALSLIAAAAPASSLALQLRGGESVWLGPQYWANPLQDWRLNNGRFECVAAGGERSVFHLTRELGEAGARFSLNVRLGRLNPQEAAEGFAGFRIGIKGKYGDYRDDAVWGIGMNVGIAASGHVFIGSLDSTAPKIPGDLDDVELLLEGEPDGSAYVLRVAVVGKDNAILAQETRRDVPAEWVRGGVALVCHSGPVRDSPDPKAINYTLSGPVRRGDARGGAMRCWFSAWKISGPKVVERSERAFGPILFSMYTLSRGVMKLTAQLAPINVAGQSVKLEVKAGDAWKQIAASPVDPESRTATFRILKWDDRRDTPYRVSLGDAHWEGVIRKDPRDKPKLVVAGLSCVNDGGFPHAEITRALPHFQPDVLLFTGDQIYERVGGFGIQRQPLPESTLDYLRKWYLFGWAFRDVMASTPSVSMPDDHDVYHGNVWGAGGRHAEGQGQPGQDSGGYLQPAAWVNMMQRTQTSHLPDPFDPTPVEQGIGVYYTSMKLGGVDFAILEDRKWKSAPKVVLPDARIVNGWAQNPEYQAPRDGDANGAQLLGERQLKFLEQWVSDWSGGTWMKVAVSQTIFANVATLPKPANTDAVTPNLPLLAPGEYAPDEVAVADHDSNGWPQSGRNAALRVLRKACAFHIAGDQHLGSTVQYGVDEFDDASWAICVPAVSNLFPRRWYPPTPDRRNTGQFHDGFGNKVTVHAVFNPSRVGIEPVEVNHRAPGYGIIEFEQATRKITASNWARWVDPSKPGAKPVAGWPITIDQLANGLPVKHRLTAIDVPSGALVQVADEGSGETLYTLRPAGGKFTPGVPKADARYTVRLLADNGRVLKSRSGLRPSS